MSESFGVEDFEKIDPVQADQDGNITSTSVTGDGEMAEEDRYISGENNESDLLGDYANTVTGAVDDAVNNAMGSLGSGEPLMSFDSMTVPEEPEPSELEPEPVQTVIPTPADSSGCWGKNVDPRVLELIYWRDVRKTGVVFGSMVFVLVALTCCTMLSVAAYLSIAILTVTLSFRIYKNVMQAVQKTNDGHPFKNLLEMDLSLRSDVIQSAADKIATNVNNMTTELRRLFLVEDYVDSIKFGLLLWLLTYVGSWFNGMTIIILGVVAIFTLPKVYETYKGPIDQNVNMVRGQLNNIMAQVSSKIPFPKKKVKAQ